MTISKDNIYKIEYILIFIPLLARFLTDNFGFTYAIMPIFDLIALIGILLSRYLTRRCNKGAMIVEKWLFLFIVAGVLSIIVNGGSSFSNLFYSARPYFRMIGAMIITALSFDLRKINRMTRYMEVLLYINAAVMTFQYVFMGLRQDVIGGTFGNSQGCNAIQNILCAFIFTVTVERFLKNRCTKRKLIINTVIVLYISILAEINVLIFELSIIGILLLVLNKSSALHIKKRNLFLICAGVAGCIVALSLFMKFNSDRVFLLSLNNILEYLGFNEGNTGVYRISRMKVFSQLGKAFYENNLLKWLFGFGLGNCSTHSTFYMRFSGLQYTYFSSSNVFLETGLCGVFVNIGVLLNGLYSAISKKKIVRDTEQLTWLNISIVMILIMIMMFFYNTTLRGSYTAFFAGTIIAIPYIIRGCEGVK